MTTRASAGQLSLIKSGPSPVATNLPSESGSSDAGFRAAEGLAVFVGPYERPTTDPVTTYLGTLEASTRTQVERRLTAIATLVAGHPLEAIDARWWALRYQHTQAIRAALVERYAPATVNVYLSAVRGVLRECDRLGLMTHEDYARAASVENVSAEVLPAGRALEAGELRALFESCAGEGTPGAARDAALLAVLYGAGLRRAEARALELVDIDVDAGEVRVRRGKGRKDRLAFLSAGARAAVGAWIALRGDAPGALLCPVTRGGTVTIRPMSLRAIGQRVKARATRAGVKPFSPHDMRRSFVSDLLDAGADLATVQRLAGHASPQTTTRYDRRGDAARQRAAELIHVPYSPGGSEDA